jgi:DNA helicase IV
LSHSNSNTVATKTSSKTEIAHEQEYLTVLYQRLDELRATTAARHAEIKRGPTVDNLQAYSEREAFNELYVDRSAELDAAERNLCFGRLDLDDGERRYIGRLGLRDAEREQLLVDWRAPASQPFYRATPLERYGVTLRRHLHTVGRRVVGIDDDVLDLDSVPESDEPHLAGEAALLASLRRSRTGRMADIVATIQGDQDRVIRSGLKGILVVEGGPGTGKTVVALHRAAYLLYTYRDQLAKRGILVLGPNATFMRYIDQVLPSLGENDVVLATIGSLFPGVDAGAEESDAAAAVKGDIRMADVLACAVAERQQVPSAPIEIRIDGVSYVIRPATCRKARARARQLRDSFTRAPATHNRARRVFVKAMLDDFTRQGTQQRSSRLMRDEDVEDLRSELAAEPAIRRALDALWPELTPPAFLAWLYADPSRLDLGAEERAALLREDPAEWTASDVPLLDELAELIGGLEETDAAERRQAAQAARAQAEAEQDARELLEKMKADDAIFLFDRAELEATAAKMVRRYDGGGPRGTLAERALADRSWTYGHVIVDEAQELSAMAWRMLRRRCPGLSMTVVGDLAQTGSASGASTWGQVLDPVAAGRWRTELLTVNYRTPKPAMAVAGAVLAVANADAVPPVAVRDSGEFPWTVETSEQDLAAVLPAVLEKELAELGDGRLAVIAPPDQAVRLAALQTAGEEVLDARVAVLTPVQAKGLEFDGVVVVDPAGIEQESGRGLADLYVALTRTTRRLGIVITGPPSAPVLRALETS